MRRVTCPCCGRPVDTGALPVTALAEIPASRHERRILKALVSAYPRRVSGDFLVEALYCDDPNGGPLRAVDVVRVTVTRLRAKLARVGWTIPHGGTGRGSTARYRLAPLAGGKRGREG